MPRTVRFAAVHAVVIGVIVLAGSLRAQNADQQRTVGEVSLPGGLAPALAAIGDPTPPDRSQFLLEFIRRIYDTPFGPRNDPREAVLQSLLAEVKAREGTAGASETLPLPLSVSTWIDAVFAGRSTPETLVSSILQSRSASLLYSALLALDDDTRAWIAGQPGLLAQLANRHSASFLAAAPGLRITPAGLRMPGGSDADPIWQSLVGQRPSEPAHFVKALMESDEGRLARFFGAVSQLTAAQARAALNIKSIDGATRVDSARRLYAVFQRVVTTRLTEHAFGRPALDPLLLASELAVDAHGEPWVPGTRAFWNAVFSDVRDAAASAKAAEGDRRRESGEAADFPWLCEQVFKTESEQRRRFTMVLFASRHLREITPATAADAIDAVRGAATYPALAAALERARVTDLTTFAAAARTAATISAIQDEGRAYRALAQFQGALALITRAASRGSVDAAQVTEFASSLSAIPLSERGDYDGRLVCWLNDRLRARVPASQPPRSAVATAGSAEEVIESAAGPLEQAALRLLAGPAPSEPRLIEWEGTRYRVDLRKAEALRIVKALGDAPRPYVSSAEMVVANADALAEAGLTRDRLARVAQDIATALPTDAPEDTENPTAVFPAGDRSVITSLERAARAGNVGAAARLAPALRLLADEMLARGLMELAYAAALGQRDGLSISASEGASRHDFGLRPALSNRPSQWMLPVWGADASQRSRVTGSLLGLDAALADFSLVPLSLKQPPRRPSISDSDRRAFIEEVALIEPAALTDADHESITGAIRRGRTRLEHVRNASDAYDIADRAGLSATRRSLLPWIAVHDPARITAFLSPIELLWLGLDGARPQALDAWGASARPRMGCLCQRMVDRRPWETYAGRWNSGMHASAFPDLNLRLAELLTELRMPAALLAPILTSATLDFVNSAISRDQDDRRGLVAFVQGLRSERIEQYLALLTTDGPLVPVEEVSVTKDKEDPGSRRPDPGAAR